MCAALDGRFASTVPQPSKRYAEQAAAAACLVAHGIVRPDGTIDEDALRVHTAGK